MMNEIQPYLDKKRSRAGVYQVGWGCHYLGKVRKVIDGCGKIGMVSEGG